MLNCDLGENESTEQTRELMALIDAANICCGVHQGSLTKTREALCMAKEYGVMIGAHPGLAVAGGRGSELPSPSEFRVLLQKQLGSFYELAAAVGTQIDYVKLHGSLYSAVDCNASLLTVYLSVVQTFGTNLGVFALTGGNCAIGCKQRGIPVWEEAFADRAYDLSGRLVKRSDRAAVLTFTEAMQRFDHWQEHGDMLTVDGATIPMHADTLCVHSDSPDAIQLLAVIQGRL